MAQRFQRALAHPFLRLSCAAALCVLAAFAANADELKLKDGTTIQGSIVGFDIDSFKVETSFGYALVRKDQVVTIFVTGSGNASDPSADKPPATENPKPAPAVDKTPAPKPPEAPSQPATRATAAAAPAAKLGPPPPLPRSTVIASSVPIPPAQSTPPTQNDVASSAANTSTSAAATRTPASTSASTAPAKPATVTVASAPPKPPEPIRETVTGNMYMNDTYRFQMFKPPDWRVLAAQRTVLPGAIAALGTDDQGTYLLIGEEPAGKALYLAAQAADKRLRDAMENFRPQGQEQMLVAGSWATAHRFRGSVDQHEWSGVVVLVPHGSQLLTIFGMTRADTDLVQIQENVIDRAIASLQFSN